MAAPLQLPTITYSGFLQWYLRSSRIDGGVQPGRRVALVLLSLLLTCAWLWLILKVVPDSQNFFLIVWTNPLFWVSIAAVHFANSLVVFLQHRIAAAGQEPPERGIVAQHERKVFDKYRAIYGTDRYYRAHRWLGELGLICFLILAIWLLMRAPTSL